MGDGCRKILVLENDTIDTHVYTEEDLFEYAKHLGMNLEFDRDLLWIARAGLYAAIPKPWLTCQAEGSEGIFYFNPETRQSVWEHPSDAFYRELFEQTVQSRITVAVTLRAEQSEHGAITLVGTKLSGAEAVRVRLMAADIFADVRPLLLADLQLPRGTVARFLSDSGVALGCSYDDKSVASIFGLTAPGRTWTAEPCSSSYVCGVTVTKMVPRPAAEVPPASLPYIGDAADAERLGFTVEMTVTF